MSIFVNDVAIGEEEIGREMQHHPAQTQEQAWYLAAQSLVIRQLLLQQAAESGLCREAGPDSSDEQEEQLIDQLLKQDVTVPEADDATCQRFYDNHPDSFVDDATSECRDFNDVEAQIRDYLHTKAMRIAVAEYIRALSYKANIKGFSM